MRFKRIHMAYLLSLVFTLPFLSNLNAQELKATASVDSIVLPIGQQTHFNLEVKQPKGVILDFPVLTDTLFKSIEILSQTDFDSLELDENSLLITKKYLITSFDSGFYVIPPMKIGINSQSGGGEIYSNALALKVITFEVDTTQGIFDIKPVEDLPYTFKEMLPWLVGGVLFIGIIILFVWLFRRIKRKEPVFSLRKEKPKEPAHVVALRELEKLKAEKLWQTDRVKLFYTQLTEILRVYIEDRFHVPAMEQTSHEILQSLSHVDIEGEAVLSNLKQILTLADLVKFAKATPLPDENDLSMMNAFFVVNQTKLVEVVSIDEIIKGSDTSNNEKQA